MCKNRGRLPKNAAGAGRRRAYLAGMTAISIGGPGFGDIGFGRFGAPRPPGIHAVVIALLRHRVTGALICLMHALGFAAWATASAL